VAKWSDPKVTLTLDVLMAATAVTIANFVATLRVSAWRIVRRLQLALLGASNGKHG
jgi:hypothetical protein